MSVNKLESLKGVYVGTAFISYRHMSALIETLALNFGIIPDDEPRMGADAFNNEKTRSSILLADLYNVATLNPGDQTYVPVVTALVSTSRLIPIVYSDHDLKTVDQWLNAQGINSRGSRLTYVNILSGKLDNQANKIATAILKLRGQ